MATNNALNAPLPLRPVQGGLGVASPTANGILVSNGASPVSSITLLDGQLLIGNSPGNPTPGFLTAGTGIAIGVSGGNITIDATGAGAFSWIFVSGTSQSLSADFGYVANNAALVTLTLPVSIAAGEVISIKGFGAGGWLLAQNSGQIVHLGDQDTTSGVSGSLASTNRYDQLELLCVVADTEFVANPPQGNITVV